MIIDLFDYLVYRFCEILVGNDLLVFVYFVGYVIKFCWGQVYFFVYFDGYYIYIVFVGIYCRLMKKFDIICVFFIG